ncbi:MAG TPA: hypothetical protein VN690_05255 [Terriglobales bacterium]|nr:hypothetical protein [Terriglobales bacterium]
MTAPGRTPRGLLAQVGDFAGQIEAQRHAVELALDLLVTDRPRRPLALRKTRHGSDLALGQSG